MIDSLRAMAIKDLSEVYKVDYRIGEVLTSLALLPLAESAGAEVCLLCDASPYAPHNQALEVGMIHSADCPVTLARQLLADIGIPINIYRVTGQYMDMRHTPHARQWRDMAGYQLATHPKWIDVSDSEVIKHRNVQIEFVRQLPLAEETERHP